MSEELAFESARFALLSAINGMEAFIAQTAMPNGDRSELGRGLALMICFDAYDMCRRAANANDQKAALVSILAGGMLDDLLDSMTKIATEARHEPI